MNTVDNVFLFRPNWRITVSADVDAVDTSHFRTLGGSENVFCIIFLNIYVE